MSLKLKKFKKKRNSRFLLVFFNFLEGANFLLLTFISRTIRKVPIFLPQASTSIQQIISFFTGKRAEFVDPRIVATNEGRESKIKLKQI